MSTRYSQPATAAEAHFSQAAFGQVERSRLTTRGLHLTTFNAGDIVPIYCREMLPSEFISIDIDSVIRQTTLLTPTMGSMFVDLYAFFVPNRVVNKSTAALFGENVNGSWIADPVSYVSLKNTTSGTTTIPVGSIADYYGFPTQQPIPNSVLAQCHDLKFRGYIEIYNDYFRDQNYQPPVPYSKLNVYEGFLDEGSFNLVGSSFSAGSSAQNDSAGAGAMLQGMYGNLTPVSGLTTSIPNTVTSTFKATMKPLKANKLHDYFTSALPSPLKSQPIFAPLSSDNVLGFPVVTGQSNGVTGSNSPLRWVNITGTNIPANADMVLHSQQGATAKPFTDGTHLESTISGTSVAQVVPANLYAAVQSGGIDISTLRTAFAAQQLFEALARGGSYYREYCANIFGLEVDNPFADIPTRLGHIRRELDLYQTAQTSSSESGNTPQGNLAAFGYTSTGGHLCDYTALEHGYLHIFAIVRHVNIYPSSLARDNFRLSLLDFYHPSFANISEQPVYLKQINPFAVDMSVDGGVFGYQEAWAEYRYEDDLVTGLMRPGAPGGDLSIWNYADDFDPGIEIADGDWLKSNSQEVLDRTLAVTSSGENGQPQFKGQFVFRITKELPMPSYSVPGMDIL